jgi:hypothetical protein
MIKSIDAFACISEIHYDKLNRDINKSINELLNQKLLGDDSIETQDKIDNLIKTKKRVLNRFNACHEREYILR